MVSENTREMASYVLLYDQNELTLNDRDWCEREPGRTRITLAALAVIMERMGVDLPSLTDENEGGE